MMVVDLSQSFFPHSKESQLARGPKRKQSKAEDRAIYKEATEQARDPKTGHILCAICGEPGTDDEMVRDHIEPRGRGGKTSLDNIQLVHEVPCHKAEHAKGKRKKTKAPTQPVIRKTDA